MRFEPGPFPLKKNTYRIQSKHLYCVRHRGCWTHRTSGLYFSSLLAIFQCRKRQGSCLLQVNNTHAPYSSEFYGDVLHEGITFISDICRFGLPSKTKRPLGRFFAYEKCIIKKKNRSCTYTCLKGFPYRGK